jgi:putative transposase
MRHEFHPPHLYEDNACYFLTASTLNGQRLLVDDARRTMLKDILKKLAALHGITLYAWVILANHYHLLLRTSERSPIYKFIKALHGQSAIRLNELDGVVGRQVWYQYWDRFPRSERDFWSYFNYIHINPVKHRYVGLDHGVLLAEGREVRIAAGRAADVDLCLQQYPHSSYHYYLRKYGPEFLMDAWTLYPIPDYTAGDDFR